jgi:alpha-tubulin suppressor-like RCC1 family protein
LKFQTVVPGGTITCGLTAGGELYCWGGNNHGQAGVGDKNGDPGTSCCYKRPRRVAAGRLFKAVAAGGIHGCAIDVDGKGFCWGYQHDGRLGNGEPGTARNVPDLPSPVPIRTDAVLVTVSGRSWHTCASTNSTQLLCWGLGEHGRLGNGSMQSQPMPTPVTTGEPFASFSIGSRHSCGVTKSGLAYCWGSNESGELGDGASAPISLPRQVPALREVSAIAVGGSEMGNGFTCALLGTGHLVCWGANDKGQRIEWDPASRPW